MCVSCIQSLANPSHLALCPYVDVECKQVTRDPSRKLQTRRRPSNYCPQNKDLFEKTTFSNSCIQLCHSARQNCRLSLSLIAQGCHSNGRRSGSPRCCKRRCIILSDTKALQICPFSEKISVMWMYGFTRPTSDQFFISCCQSQESVEISMSLSMTIRNPFISNSQDSGLISASVKVIIQQRKSKLLIGNDIASIEFRQILVSISYYSSPITRYHTIFRTSTDLTKIFPNEKSFLQLFFYSVLQVAFLPPAQSKCIEILIIYILQLLSFM